MKKVISIFVFVLLSLSLLNAQITPPECPTKECDCKGGLTEIQVYYFGADNVSIDVYREASLINLIISFPLVMSGDLLVIPAGLPGETFEVNTFFKITNEKKQECYTGIYSDCPKSAWPGAMEDLQIVGKTFGNFTIASVTDLGSGTACTLADIDADWHVGGNIVDSTNTKFGTLNNENVTFISNNQIRGTITKSGDFGIGTATPNAKLDVAGATIIQSTLDVDSVTTIHENQQSTNTSNGALVVSGGAGIGKTINVGINANIGKNVSVGKNLDVANNTHIGNNLDVDQNANVDVDLTVGNNLDVSNNAHVGNNLDVDQNANVDVDLTVGNNLDVSNNAHVGNNLDVDQNANVDVDLTVGDDAFVGDDAIVGDDLQVGDDAVINGTLGVGISTPSRKVHVVGDAIRLSTSLANVGRFIEIRTDGWGTDLNSRGDDLFIRSINHNVYINTLGPDGKVGIGTENVPNFIGGANISNYKLYVSGGILTEEVRVRTGWADYVFDENYSLLPLHEVENFIQINGHLPNTPSENEVLENGLSVGEATAKQQEKIEEIFLHLIEMEKQVKALQAENATLKQRLENLDNQ